MSEEVKNPLTREERETIIYLNAADRDNIHVFSDDPVLQKRLDEIADEEDIETMSNGFSKKYRLEKGQVSFRKKMSPERKEKMARLARKRFGHSDENKPEETDSK